MFGGSIFFLANDGSIVTLGGTNITFDRTFLTFGFTFFFSHIWRCRPHIVQFQHHMWLYFCHIWWSLYFFLTFDGSIVTLGSTNITLDYTFLTFGGTFCHIQWFFFFFLTNYHNTLETKKITEILLEPKNEKLTLKLKKLPKLL